MAVSIEMIEGEKKARALSPEKKWRRFFFIPRPILQSITPQPARKWMHSCAIVAFLYLSIEGLFESVRFFCVPRNFEDLSALEAHCDRLFLKVSIALQWSYIYSSTILVKSCLYKGWLNFCIWIISEFRTTSQSIILKYTVHPVQGTNDRDASKWVYEQTSD